MKRMGFSRKEQLFVAFSHRSFGADNFDGNQLKLYCTWNYLLHQFLKRYLYFKILNMDRRSHIKSRKVIQHTFGDNRPHNMDLTRSIYRRRPDVFIPCPSDLTLTEEEVTTFLKTHLNSNARIEDYNIRFMPIDTRTQSERVLIETQNSDMNDWNQQLPLDELEEGQEEPGDEMDMMDYLVEGEEFNPGSHEEADFPPAENPCSHCVSEPPEEILDTYVCHRSSKSDTTVVPSPSSNGAVDIYLPTDDALPRPPNSHPLYFYIMIINEIVAGAKRDDELIIAYKHFRVYTHHLACFVPKPGQDNWLHDLLMDYYLTMITERNAANPQRYAKTYVFNCTFYTILSSDDGNGLELVKNAADENNIFDSELIIIPVCEQHHWRLISVNVAARTVTVFNSWQYNSQANDERILNNIVNYLKQEYTRVNPSAGCKPKWTLRQASNIPQQTNFNDCGVYTLLFADYLSKRTPFDFEGRHMTYFRAKMMYECITGRLLPVIN